MLAAAFDDLYAVAVFLWHVFALHQQLGVAQNGLQRRTKFVTDARQVAAFGVVGTFGQFLGLLQFQVGLIMGFNLQQQPAGLPRGLLLCDLPAFAGQQVQPAHHPQDNQQDKEQCPQRLLQQHDFAGGGRLHLIIDQGQQRATEGVGGGEHDEKPDHTPIHGGEYGIRQQRSKPLFELVAQSTVGLADVHAARIQRTAQRADGALVCRAVGDVITLETVFADAAFQRVVCIVYLQQVINLRRLAGEIETATGEHCQRRHRDKTDTQADKVCQVPGSVTKQSHVAQHTGNGSDNDRYCTDGVNVVQVRAFELHIGRAQSQWFVDQQVCRQRAQPAQGDNGKQAQNGFQSPVHAQLHEQQGDRDVEYQPHDAARMAVSQPREKVGPGDGAGIGIGDVDLHLGYHHHQSGQYQGQGG